MAKFVCEVCGYVHEGTVPPTECPVCKAPASSFRKKGIDVNRNSYIITYSVVMVVIVAVLLSVAALALKDRQMANQLNEKKQQIVKALGLDPAVNSYSDVISSAVILDEAGNQMEGVDDNAVFAAVDKLKESKAEGRYPLFLATDGSVVVPLRGNGLWGEIWGYIAIESDMDTVKGVVFDHAGETPGLGAEITTEKHQAMYVGKKIFSESELVAIRLVKGGAQPSDKMYANEVDAITGGTKTSDGVSAMLLDCLTAYKAYFVAHRALPEPVAAPVEESNVTNTESNEQ